MKTFTVVIGANHSPSLFLDFFFFSTSLSEPCAEPDGLALFTVGASSVVIGDLSLCSSDETEPPMSSSLLVELLVTPATPLDGNVG